jgi:hypothetical protein
VSCNGINVIVLGDAETSDAFYYDAVTLELIGVAEGGPYQCANLSSFGCQGGQIPSIDVAECEMVLNPWCPS